MKATVSKTLFIVEILVLALPLSVLFLIAAFVIVLLSISGQSEYDPLVSIVAVIFTAVSLASFWTLAYKYMKYGNDSLNTASGFLWSFAFLGAIYSVFGLLYSIALYFNAVAELFLFQFFRLGAAGVPLLIPLLHLYLEFSRESYKPSEKAISRRRELRECR